MQSAPVRPAHPAWLHLALFVLTACSTCFTFQQGLWGAGLPESERWSASLAFTGALLAILGAHEMGHYVLARWHKVDATLPYFIPLPFLGVGTLGAVIRIRGRIPTRNALVDIGAAGPLAGLAVALPLIFWGMAHSTRVEIPNVPPPFPGEMSLWSLGQELQDWLVSQVTGVEPPPEPAFHGQMLFLGDNLFLKAAQWLVLGPLPPGQDVVLNPVVQAGWFGLLVTLLNLLPVGQLDGGHVSFALWGPKATWVGKAAAGVLLLLTLFYTFTWALWLVVTTKVVGFSHPEVLQPEEPLGRGRKVVGALCFLALVGCAMPAPFFTVTW